MLKKHTINNKKKNLDLNKIKELLKNKNIASKQFAIELGITESGFHKIIRENTTTIKTLKKISDLLNVPVEYFFVNDKNNNEIKNMKNPVKSNDTLSEIQQLKYEISNLQKKYITILEENKELIIENSRLKAKKTNK
jgi:transcriptional regulator with XRE-family HTH domain